ncbi:HAD family hydrolase [Streptomyces sp. NPDC054766]
MARACRWCRPFGCLPGVREGLDALRGAGWSLKVATNGAVDIQRAKLETTGLAPLFDGICISEAVGARKPERSHFVECGALLNAGGWMVGDNPVTDIGGARAAGLRTVWVAGGREWTDGLRKPWAGPLRPRRSSTRSWLSLVIIGPPRAAQRRPSVLSEIRDQRPGPLCPGLFILGPSCSY